jgi:hypothetical protein
MMFRETLPLIKRSGIPPPTKGGSFNTFKCSAKYRAKIKETQTRKYKYEAKGNINQRKTDEIKMRVDRDFCVINPRLWLERQARLFLPKHHCYPIHLAGYCSSYLPAR